jgi:hypothetical protein
MIEIGLAVLVLGFLCLIAIPLMIAGTILLAVVKLAFALILLPVKLIAWLFAGLFQGFFFLFKLAGAVILGAVLVLLGLVLLAVPLLSLAPLFLLIGLGWLAWRMARPARAEARS